jgi:D-glycero-D-manno-heptose 1,7-bisphosphate phosphatase
MQRVQDAQVRTLFVDRDGTINVEKGYVHREVDFEFLPGAREALQLASRSGLAIYIVTNQAGIARGLYSEEQFLRFTASMVAMLAAQGVLVADVLYCPHHPDAGIGPYKLRCDCRKPAPGLLQRAIADHALATANAVMIGDKNSDVDAGRAIGLRTYLVETGYGAVEKATTCADHVVPDLLAAVKHIILQNGQSNS